MAVEWKEEEEGGGGLNRGRGPAWSSKIGYF